MPVSAWFGLGRLQRDDASAKHERIELVRWLKLGRAFQGKGTA